jgi:hypothetical protein
VKLIALVCCLFFLLVSPALAGKAYAPPPGKLFHGVSDTGQLKQFEKFEKLVGSHPAVMSSYEVWDRRGAIEDTIRRWEKARVRGMISLSTAAGHGFPALITSKQIANGRGDGFLVWLGRTLKDWNRPVYLNIFPEMNGAWNAYCAFKRNGVRRKGNSTKQFKQAYRRISLIVSGGRVKKINRKLRGLKMPKIRAATRLRLSRPKVATMYVPQWRGGPERKDNGPMSYWPGSQYVDWGGIDQFASWPNIPEIRKMQQRFKDKPFFIGEYGLNGADDTAWLKEIFSFIKQSSRAKMLVYHQGFGKPNPFRLQHYPNSAKLIGQEVAKSRFLSYPPEFK